MDENKESWKTSVPADLIPAVKHLRESFTEGLNTCGHLTKTMCYLMLHDVPVDARTVEYIRANHSILDKADQAAKRRFEQSVATNAESTIVKAHFELYLAIAENQVLHIFTDLVRIGHVHRGRLDIPYLSWAEAQSKDAIRSYAHRTRQWVRDVCDKTVDAVRDDPEERREWQAPSFLTMRPLGNQPHEAAHAWERNDVTVSWEWLESLSDYFVLSLESTVEWAVGNAAVEFAKLSTPIATGAAEKDIVAKANPSSPQAPTKREAGKLKTQAKHKELQEAYRALKKHDSGKSNVWYSRKLARSPIGKGFSPETIRKVMKK